MSVGSCVPGRKVVWRNRGGVHFESFESFNFKLSFGKDKGIAIPSNKCARLSPCKSVHPRGKSKLGNKPFAKTRPREDLPRLYYWL